MGPCSLFWVCAIICMIAFKPYVYCGQCGVNGDCEVTDYTTTTCDAATKQCGCNPGYAPIRTGCGLKLAQPTVSATDGRSRYLFTGGTGTLRCSTVPGAISYRWTLPDKSNNNSQTLTITAAGDYSCQAISGTESLNSDASTKYTVESIGGSPIAYAGTLVAAINYSDNKIFTDNSITVACQGVPMGYSSTVSFVDGSDTALATSAASSVSAQLVMAAAKTGLTLACSLPPTNQVTFTKSVNVVNLPTPSSPNPITVVAITAVDSFGPVSSGETYKNGTLGPLLTCTTTPVEAFLDKSKPLEYDFQANGVSKQKSSANTYQVNINAASSISYSCIATHNLVTVSSTAPGFVITGSTDFLTAPVVTMVKPTTAFIIGSTLVLSCGTSKGTAGSYAWLFGDKVIDGQNDWTIQLYNFTEADIGVYTCRARKSRYTTDSTFHAIMKPTVTRVTSGTLFGTGGDYLLKCNTGSNVSVGWTYLWKKDNSETSIKTDTYTITNATGATHNGTYSCTSTYNGASGNSDPITVAVVAPGKRCTGDMECTGTGFSGKCTITTDPKVCECSANYILKGETCASGAVALISCVLMVIMASLGSVFF